MTVAYDLLGALPVGPGRWGESAAEFQKTDARAVFDPDGPRLHASPAPEAVERRPTPLATQSPST